MSSFGIWSGRCVFVIALLASPYQLRSQPLPKPHPELSSTIDLDLAVDSPLELVRAAEFIENGQLDAAIETYRALMENEGDKILPAPVSKNRHNSDHELFITVRELCQRKLATLAAVSQPALEAYRARVDPLTERWLKEATSARDQAKLRRLTEQFFLSTHGDDAALLLGEMHFANGEFTAARRCWESISPLLKSPPDGPKLPYLYGDPLWLALRKLDPQDADYEKHWADLIEPLTAPRKLPPWLVYPDTDISLAKVRARLALVSIVEGTFERAAIEIEFLKRLHPDAVGELGGKRGNYAELLSALLKQSAEWEPLQPPTAWNTFAGSQDRKRTATGDVDPGGPAIWSFKLPVESAVDEIVTDQRIRIAEDDDALLSYHPVVAEVVGVGKVVIIPQRTQLHALRLHDGVSAFDSTNPTAGSGTAFSKLGDHTDTLEETRRKVFPQQRPYAGAPRYTLNVWGDKLLARMGSPLTGIRRTRKTSDEKPVVRVADLSRRGGSIRDFQQSEDGWAFDGTPVTDGINMFSVIRHAAPEDARATLHIVCNEIKSGRLKWRRKIVTAASPAGQHADDVTSTLLSMSEGVLYLNTHLGVVAAVDAVDGNVRWISRYPRGKFPTTEASGDDRYFFRDLTPCFVHQGLVICAPADSDRVFALDAATGLLRWQTPQGYAPDIIHLLGVGNDRVIASGNYLYWFDIHTGNPAGVFPSQGENVPGYLAPNPSGYGRGVLVDDQIYWPTRDKIYRFAQATERVPGGARTKQLGVIELLANHGVRGGNLLVVDGVLLVAGPESVTALNMLGRPLQRASNAD